MSPVRFLNQESAGNLPFVVVVVIIRPQRSRGTLPLTAKDALACMLSALLSAPLWLSEPDREYGGYDVHRIDARRERFWLRRGARVFAFG